MREEEKILRRIPKEIIILSIVAAVVFSFIFDILTGIFILAGGIVSALSFMWLKETVYRFLIPEKKKAVGKSLIIYSLRILLIIVIFSFIIFFFSKKIFAFAGGFSIIIIVFSIEAGITLFGKKEWKN